MAAPSKYPSPDEQLLLLARQAKAAGEPFGQFWRRTVREGLPNVLTSTPPAKRPWLACVLWPSDSGDRITWQGAIYESVEGWERAYEDVPPLASEQALVLLQPVFEKLRQLDESVDELPGGLGTALAVA